MKTRIGIAILLFAFSFTANSQDISTGQNMCNKSFRYIKQNVSASEETAYILIFIIHAPSKVALVNQIMDNNKDIIKDNCALTNVVIDRRVQFSFLVFTVVKAEARADIIQYY